MRYCLYDLHHLAEHPEVQALLEKDELCELLRAVQAHDAVAGVKRPTREWKTLPLSRCRAYCDAGANLQQARQAYEQHLPGLLHTTAPAFSLILETMQQIATRLKAFDK